MDDRRRNELLNQYDELTMQLLIDEAAENDGNLLWEDFTAHGPETMSKDLDNACEKLIVTAFKKEERKQRWRKTARRSLRAAVVVLCLLAGLYSVVMKVDALRVPVINFIIESYERFSVVSFTGETPSKLPSSVREVMELYQPVGYTLFNDDFPSEDFGSLIYTDAHDNVLKLLLIPSSSSVSLDTENTMVSETTICGRSVLVREKDTGRCSLEWLNRDGTVIYSLSATAITKDELIHMAALLIDNEP